MRAVVGDETGLLKVVDLEDGRQMGSYGDQGRANAIMGVNRLDDVINKFSVLRCDGQLELWKMDDEGSLEIMSFANTGVSDAVNSFPLVSSDKTSIASFGANGDVAICKLDESRNTWQESDSGESCSQGFQARGPLSAGCSCTDGIALGGKENDLKFYDINTMQLAWSAANVPYDKLRLRVPIWITAVAFLQPAVDSISKANIVTGTGYKHVRLYDSVASQRPITSLDIGDFRVSSISVANYSSGECPHQLYIGDVGGGVNLWDLRMNRKVGTLRGSVGSVRDMQMDTSSSYLATVGLDRILHVYSTRSNKVTNSVYLKTRLNRCILFGSNSSDGEVDDDEAEEGDDDSNAEDVIEEFIDSDDEALINVDDNTGDEDEAIDLSSSEAEESDEDESEEDAEEEIIPGKKRKSSVSMKNQGNPTGKKGNGSKPIFKKQFSGKKR